ncbi:hypothetical protein EDB84DRAFT_1674608 [Lactarius hengduanensis]|nr:hypothetical protein EDB84DRAFT_1674608 [Lactarius hengduanensis]
MDLQPGKTDLQDNAPDGAPGGPPDFNQAALAQLEAMGPPLVRCQKALMGHPDPEAAMEWLFAQMEDPGSVAQRNTKALTNLASRYRRPYRDTERRCWRRRYRVECGARCLRTQARNGLCEGDGARVHIRTEAGWVLFNDEKVACADPESVRALKALAYLYVLERVTTRVIQQTKMGQPSATSGSRLG